ncbi:hypothetical protein OROMI_016304 [Orobanche minor]
MDEKGKYLLSLGSGSLLGSAANLATSKLLLRQSGRECANVDFIDSNDLYDESLVEEFYREASVHFHSVKKGGDVAEISATIRGVEICINRQLLKDVFSLPSSGLKLEELESFGLEVLMSTFWCVFICDSAEKKVHPSCHKKRIILRFIYLHDFCCRTAKKIGPGKFIGGYKPTAYNRDIIPADRPSVFELPQSKNPRDVTEKSKAVNSRKRKHSVSDRKSPLVVPEKKKKNLKKAYKPKPTEVAEAPVEAQIQENAE